MGERSQEECSFVMNSQLQLNALVHKRHHKHSGPFEPSTQKHPLFCVAFCQSAVERNSLAGQPGRQRPRGLVLQCGIERHQCEGAG
jgi:hypothetical protein